MKLISSPVVFLLLVVLLVASCRKREGIQKTSTYSFTNQNVKPLTLDIYGSEADYGLNTNRLQQHLIAPGEKVQVEFEALKTYWIDWYSPDYSLSNWRASSNSSGQPEPVAGITVAAMVDQFLLSATRDTSRSVLIGEGGVSSTWLAKVENAPMMNGIHRITLRKDFRGEYIYTDAGGTSYTTPIRFAVTGISYYNNIPQSIDLSIMNDQRVRIIDAFCHTGTYTYLHTGRDTLLLAFAQSQHYYNTYPAVRQ